MILFSGSSNSVLAKQLATALNSELGEVESTTFANGERRIRVLNPVKGQHAIIVQSFSQPVDAHILEFVLMADALERAGARSVTAVIPWLAYSLQDKVFRDGEPLAARVIADIVSNSYVQRVLLLDLHNASIAGFFSVPTEHIRALPLFSKYVKEKFDLSKAVVVSPDFGGLKQARVFADAVGLDLINVDKHRDLQTGDVTPVGLSGDAAGKICFVYDDVINTGRTVAEVARFLKSKGAKEVHFLVTHGLFAGDGLEKIQDDAIDSIVITNSVHHPDLPEKVIQLSVAELLTAAIIT